MGDAPAQPVLRSISPEATPEEVAAILAAVAASMPGPALDDDRDDTLHEWVHAARLRAHRSGRQRGPWRLSGRIARRSRA
jgi:hypothetical protein